MFLPREEVDQAWASVVELVLAGELGHVAKVSTARPSPNSVCIGVATNAGVGKGRLIAALADIEPLADAS